MVLRAVLLDGGAKRHASHRTNATSGRLMILGYAAHGTFSASIDSLLKYQPL